MGRVTHNFRQSKRSMTGSQSAQAYAKVSRIGNWYGKITSLLKVRGKIQDYGKS